MENYTDVRKGDQRALSQERTLEPVPEFFSLQVHVYGQLTS